MQRKFWADSRPDDAHPRERVRTWSSRFSRLGLLAALTVSACSLLLPRPAFAQTAPANSSIVNQATATYTDGSGVSRNATSNPVTTTVQQVAALTLTANGSATGVPTSKEYYPHTVTNTGNGTDTFTLTVAEVTGSDNFNVSPRLLPDANQDGVPDSLTTTVSTTGALAVGGRFSFVVEHTVPTGATVGQTGQSVVTATSVFNAQVSASNTDTVTITTNADVTVNKAITDLSGNAVSSGAPGSGPYRITVTFRNNGSRPATSLSLVDTLNAGFTYVPGSARSSYTGGTALTDDTSAESSASLSYQFDSTGRAARIDVPTLATNEQQSVSFNVTITSGTAPGNLPNTVLTSFFDGSTNQTNRPSNTVNFTVTQVATLTYTGDTQGPVPQGATVVFNNVLTNTGNGTDTFDIRLLTGNTFPAGTTFRILNQAGTAPLTNTDGVGTIDTGPVASGGTYTVKVEAVLPIGAFGSGPFTVQTSATSAANTSVSATATDTLTTITRSTVDIQNTAGTEGVGAGPEATPVRTVNGTRGTTVSIPITVRNTSTLSDSFNLDVSTTTNFSPPTALPAGYRVTFRDSAQNVVTSTGTLTANGTFNGFADVVIPANATPTDLDLFFRALSPTTGAQDVIFDRVTVGSSRGLTLNGPQTATIFEGGSVVYTQTLTNTGNVAETAGTIATTDSATGFTSTVYVDDGDGTFDAGDQVVTNLSQITVGTGPGLDPGEAVTLFVRVTAPAGATAGTQDNTVLTVSGTGTGAPSATTTDTTTVVAGNLTLVKNQALDSNNDGTPNGAYGDGAITTGAIPGAGIRYRIVVTNTGQSSALNVIVTDPTPAFTTYSAGDGTTSATGIAVYTLNGTTFTAATSAPAVGGTGTLSWNIGTLAPGQSATVYFGVRIRP